MRTGGPNWFTYFLFLSLFHPIRESLCVCVPNDPSNHSPSLFLDCQSRTYKMSKTTKRPIRHAAFIIRVKKSKRINLTLSMMLIIQPNSQITWCNNVCREKKKKRYCLSFYGDTNSFNDISHRVWQRSYNTPKIHRRLKKKKTPTRLWPKGTAQISRVNYGSSTKCQGGFPPYTPIIRWLVGGSLHLPFWSADWSQK